MTTTPIRLFSVEEYHRMAEVGILQPEERVELIEGQVIPMAAKNPPHSATTIDHHPSPNEVFLLVEVADTTLNYDRQVKAAAYATATIADYWVLDVNNHQVFVLRNPRSGAYRQQTILLLEDTISPLAFPSISISVDRLFPWLMKRQSNASEF